MEFQIFDTIKQYAPWIIVLLITQGIKVAFLDKLVDWLKRLLCFVIPAIVSAAVWFLFSMPAFEVWSWLQSTASAWVLAVFGYDGVKAIVLTFKGTIGKKEGE